jgi:Homeobox KN domain
MHPNLPSVPFNDPFAPTGRDPQYRQPFVQVPPLVLGYPPNRYDPSVALRQYEPPGQYPFGFGMNGQNNGYHTSRKRRGNLPKEATKVLRQWFDDHHESPYPTEEEKNTLCTITNLQMTQVCSFPACPKL